MTVSPKLGLVAFALCGGAILVAQLSCRSVARHYRQPVQKHYYVSGQGETKAGPYTVKWWTLPLRRTTLYYEEDPQSLETPVTVVVNGPDWNERLSFRFRPTYINGATSPYPDSLSTMSAELNVPWPMGGGIMTKEPPTAPQQVVLKPTLVRSVRVWDTIDVQNASYYDAGEEVTYAGSGTGSSRWDFSKATAKSRLELPLSVQKGTNGSTDRLAVDLSRLRERYKAQSFGVMITESSLGPDLPTGGGTSGVSFQPNEWKIFMAPNTPFSKESRSFDSLWIRYYVDVVVAEHPFEVKLTVSGTPIPESAATTASNK